MALCAALRKIKITQESSTGLDAGAIFGRSEAISLPNPIPCPILSLARSYPLPKAWNAAGQSRVASHTHLLHAWVGQPRLIQLDVLVCVTTLHASRVNEREPKPNPELHLIIPRTAWKLLTQQIRMCVCVTIAPIQTTICYPSRYISST